jgi:hypothetical protein
MKIRDVVLRGMDGQFSEFTHLHREGRDQPHPMTRKVEAANCATALGMFQVSGNIDTQTRPNSFLSGHGIHRQSFNKTVAYRVEAV